MSITTFSADTYAIRAEHNSNINRNNLELTEDSPFLLIHRFGGSFIIKDNTLDPEFVIFESGLLKRIYKSEYAEYYSQISLNVSYPGVFTSILFDLQYQIKQDTKFGIKPYLSLGTEYIDIGIIPYNDNNYKTRYGGQISGVLTSNKACNYG